MILTTTQAIPGFRSTEVLGIIHTTSMLSTDTFGDMFAAIKNFVGGKVSNYERLIDKARSQAFEKLLSQGEALGADAVIGISVDVETMSYTKGGFLSVSILGTAVRCIEDSQGAAPSSQVGVFDPSDITVEEAVPTQSLP